MSGEIVRRTENPDVIGFQHTTLHIGEAEQLRALLDTPTKYVNLLSQAEPDFELPALSMTLYAEREQSPESLQLHATSHFTPIDILQPSQTLSWQDALKVELFDLYPDSTKTTMPHDSDSLYIEIGTMFYGRVATYAELDRCAIEVDLIPQDRFHKFAGTVIDADLPDELPDPYLILKEFTGLWLRAHDIVVENSGYRPNPINLSLRSMNKRVSPKPSQEQQPSGVESLFPAQELINEQRLGFNYVGGLAYAKTRLQEIVEVFNDTDARALYDIEPTHFMLYGPAGTGKTTLVEILAGEIDAELIKIVSSDVIEKWVGSSAQNLDQIFKDATQDGYPKVIFFDEFEALGGKSEKLTSSERRDVLKIFNTQITDITRNHPNIIIACATNADTHEIEPALIRSGRLEPIQAGLPTADERIDIWAAILTRSMMAKNGELEIENIDNVDKHVFRLYDQDINPRELSLNSDGMTGADFEAVLGFARRRCYKQYKETGSHRLVCQQDLLDGIRAIQQR